MEQFSCFCSCEWSGNLHHWLTAVNVYVQASYKPLNSKWPALSDSTNKHEVMVQSWTRQGIRWIIRRACDNYKAVKTRRYTWKHLLRVLDWESEKYNNLRPRKILGTSSSQFSSSPQAQQHMWTRTHVHTHIHTHRCPMLSCLDGLCNGDNYV